MGHQRTDQRPAWEPDQALADLGSPHRPPVNMSLREEAVVNGGEQTSFDDTRRGQRGASWEAGNVHLRLTRDHTIGRGRLCSRPAHHRPASGSGSPDRSHSGVVGLIDQSAGGHWVSCQGFPWSPRTPSSRAHHSLTFPPGDLAKLITYGRVVCLPCGQY